MSNTTPLVDYSNGYVKKAGRPRKPDKKQTKTIRLYPSDIAAITAQHDTIQKWINKVVKQISEIK
jgi:hypothetical protein